MIVFGGLRKIVDALGLSDLVYVGFGSVWFSDFMIAHRDLRIETMVSIESNSIVFKRAQFNRPFRTIDIFKGLSADVIPVLLTKKKYVDRPWIVWLDYEKPIDQDSVNELSDLVNTLPPNSALIVTCNARAQRYGGATKRIDWLQALFGDAVESTLTQSMVDDDVSFMDTLRRTMQNFLLSTALQNARAGGYVPAFSLGYQDGSPMVTVGGILPGIANVSTVQGVVRKRNWEGLVNKPIITAPLTMKEVAALQSQLPNRLKLTRKHIRSLGFDLEEKQIESFASHYLLYPNFAQISS